VQRNSHLFAGCNEQFLSRFMLNLVEVFLMPGESILKRGEIARELRFAYKGILVVTDAKGALVELLSGEGDILAALVWQLAQQLGDVFLQSRIRNYFNRHLLLHSLR
jgi:hypothetical protein